MKKATEKWLFFALLRPIISGRLLDGRFWLPLQ